MAHIPFIIAVIIYCGPDEPPGIAGRFVTMAGLRDWGWLTRSQVIETMTPLLKNRTEEIVSAYENAMPGASPSSILRQINTDRDWHLPHLQLAEAKAKGGGKLAYLWYVDAEVISSGVLSNGRAEAFSGSATGQFTSAFANFAKGGNANHDGIPKWNAYAPDTRSMMVFGFQTHEVKGTTKTVGIWKNDR